MFDISKQIPITISIAVLTAIAFLMPSMTQWMELDLGQSLVAQIGQLFSCHLLHWSFDHLAWDLFMFVLVGAICECRSRLGYLSVLFFSAILIPISVAHFSPMLGSYRGLSGLDTGMFAFAAVLLIKEAIEQKNWASVGIYAVMFAGLIGKTVFELTVGGTLFVESSEFTPVPVAHIVGAIIGAIVGTLVALGRRLFPLNRPAKSTCCRDDFELFQEARELEIRAVKQSFVTEFDVRDHQ